jgi:hypothetical protein
MTNLKHVAKLSSNGRRCVVAYRVLPEDPDHCLVVYSDSLDSDQHDTLIKLVESDTGQSSYELADAMARTQLPDGRNMLEAFHRQGKLTMQPTKTVTMVPNNQTTVNLHDLNEMIAKEQGVSIEDLAVKPKTEKKQTKSEITEGVEDIVGDNVHSDTPLSDEDLAKSYRSQADKLSKEAAQLRRQAEELVPTKKKSKTAVSE